MSTINKTTMREILANDGIFPGDPCIATAYAYRSPRSGEELYAVYWETRFDRLLDEFPDAICLFSDGIITDAGKRFLTIGTAAGSG